jgi:hypothetical protein
MSEFEAPALPGFGRDYSQANWDAQVARPEVEDIKARKISWAVLHA